MNGQDPLAALHPLREPALVGWWPPAPGWWLLALIMLIGTMWCGFLIWRQRRRNAYRRIARRQLAAIQEQFQRDGDTNHCVAAVNALLKSVAVTAYPRRQVASISGKEWLALINEPLDPQNHLDQSYLSALYSNQAGSLPIEQVIASADRWIGLHRGSTT